MINCPAVALIKSLIVSLSLCSVSESCGTTKDVFEQRTHMQCVFQMLTVSSYIAFSMTHEVRTSGDNVEKFSEMQVEYKVNMLHV